jgi:predicted lipid-binding transport protein (Tim44 family)
MDDRDPDLHLDDILAADEAHKSPARQWMSGLGGLIGLLGIGLVAVLIVLWTAV